MRLGSRIHTYINIYIIFISGSAYGRTLELARSLSENSVVMQKVES